jgi:hypothetical protein
VEKVKQLQDKRAADILEARIRAEVAETLARRAQEQAANRIKAEDETTETRRHTKAALDQVIREQALQALAEHEATKKEAARLEAERKEQEYIRARYHAAEQAELKKFNATKAEVAKAEAEAARKAAEEDAFRKKSEEEHARLLALAALAAATKSHKIALTEEAKKYAQFIKAEEEELARIEAEKAKLTGETTTIPGDFVDLKREREIIREHVRKEIAAHGTNFDADELLKRLNTLKVDTNSPPRKRVRFLLATSSH